MRRSRVDVAVMTLCSWGYVADLAAWMDWLFHDEMIGSVLIELGHFSSQNFLRCWQKLPEIGYKNRDMSIIFELILLCLVLITLYFLRLWDSICV